MSSLPSLVMIVVIYSHSIPTVQNIRVSNAFKNAAIVPDIIPEPQQISSTFTTQHLVFVLEAKFRTLTRRRRDENNTLIMIVPDLPTAAAPTYLSTIHVLVVNILGENLLTRAANTVNVPGQKIAGGRDIAPYIPVTFYHGIGYRRYIFLLYIQTRTIDVSDRNLIQLAIDRIGFSVTKFGQQYGLGELVAGNYFVSSLESSSERYCRD